MAKIIKAPKGKYEIHKLSSLFPPMNDEEYKALLSSLKKNGYDENLPIYLFENQILDGGNRYTACEKLKIKPVFKEYTGDDPLGFVIERNLTRRNLSPSQSAIVAAKIADEIKERARLEKEAATAARAAAKTAGKPAPKAKKSANSQSGKTAKSSRTTNAKAAKALNVSARSVAAAAALEKADPAKAAEVLAGKTTLHAATKEVAKAKTEKEKKLDLYATAAGLVDKVCGEGFSDRVTKLNTRVKDIIQMSGLIEEEMRRIKPLLESSWSYQTAMGYKPHTFTGANSITQLLQRAQSEGGKFLLLINGYEVEVRKVVDPQSIA